MASGVLIVGGGLAALFCALRLAPQPVTVLCAAPLGEGASSVWAQGGVASAMADDDSFELHMRDTVVAGAGLVDEPMALGMVADAPARIADLAAYGAPFDRDASGRFLLSREAAHSRRRIVRVGGDVAGRAIMAALIARVRETPSIQCFEGFYAEQPLMKDGRFCGVLARDVDGASYRFEAAETVLATGGAGALYRVTTNPPQASGGGLAIAAIAGARVADVEFVQFHPTAVDVGRDPAPLATEALRGDGAHLINRFGERFMTRLHADAELAPRDVVARGVFEELRAGRRPTLDARSAVGTEFPGRFPSVYAACRSAGVDPVSQPIPVAPAAHYHMGGVLTDARGATSMPGLWAIGEAAATGVHGANRLASNSLLEATVFAARAAESLSLSATGQVKRSAMVEKRLVAAQDDLVASLRTLMDAYVGVIREGGGLAHALRQISRFASEARSAAVSNKTTAALLIAAAAWRRKESRGGHARSDFSSADPSQARRATLSLEEARAIAREVS